jgi:hypothetical protein
MIRSYVEHQWAPRDHVVNPGGAVCSVCATLVATYAYRGDPMTTPPVQRPGSVTIVVILTWITAIFALIGAAILFVVATTVNSSDLPATKNVMFAAAVIALVLGLVTAWVAYALSKGSNFARFLVSLVQVLNIANAIWTWIELGGNYVISAILNIAIAMIILILVWNRRANEFFATR